jgi:hypothetical protein
MDMMVLDYLRTTTTGTPGALMSKADDRKMAALVKKLSAQSATKKADKRRRYDPTLQHDEDGDDTERRNFFAEMKKREF